MMDTLEKMRAAGYAESEEGLTTPPEEDAELVLEDEQTPDAVVADGESDDSIALQDDEQGHSRVEVPKATLSQLRRTRREARDEATQKDAELTAVRQELNQLKAATLKKPNYVDFPDDASYEAALFEYRDLVGSGAEERLAPPPTARPAQPQQQDFSEQINAHLDRAEKLGVNLDKFVQAERTVRATLNDAVTDALIAHVGPGSEKAILVLGSRPAELARVQQMLMTDRTGLSVTAHLARLASDARISKKTISDAPPPTRSPSGGGHVPASDAEYEKRMSKLEKAGDAQGMFELRRAKRKAAATAS